MHGTFDPMVSSAELLIGVAAEAEERIQAVVAGKSAAVLASTGFDQLGLLDGLAIVREYVDAGELGIAYDHVCYMVKETGIALSRTAATSLAAVAVAIGVAPPTVAIASQTGDL